MKSENIARVDAYLDQVLAPLTRRLSAVYQQELWREMNAHLWERVDAYQELGQSEDDAVTEALRRFGGTEDLARQWLMYDRQSAGHELWASTRSALRLSVPLLLAFWGLARVLAWWVINCLPSTYLGALGIIYSDNLLVILGAGFACLSVWAGSVQGRQAPKRSGLGMFSALSAAVAAGSAFHWLGRGIGLDRTVFGDIFTSLPLMAAAWMPLACTSAALTGWWTQKVKSRQIA